MQRSHRNWFPKTRIERPENSPKMKHNKHHNNAKNAEPPLMPVTFAFTHPTATKVCVAGTFNDWHPEAKAMHPVGTGRWLRQTALPPGTYEYCLVVDGRYLPDPLATESVANPFGGRNSLLKVPVSAEARHLADAESTPLENAHQTKAQTL
jgi:1,4-alpha-glucan branching enzyme